MKYAHTKLLEVEKQCQLFQEKLEDHAYIDPCHKTFVQLLTHLMNNHMKYISSQNLLNTHLTQTFQ